MGVKALQKVQIGIETTAGTSVAATKIWRGRGALEDTRVMVFPEENVGYLGGVNRVYTPKLEGKIELEETEATFEQLPYLLTAGILAQTSGSADGVGSDKIYTYTLPTTSANTISTLTVEGGDEDGEEEMEYAHCQKITLSGVAGEALMMSATLIGRQVVPSTFTNLSLPMVEEILCSKGKLYIDLVSTTIGSSLKANTFRGFKLEIETGWTPKYTGDGQLYFSFIKNVGPKVKLDVTFEADATMIAEKVLWRARTARQIKMLFEGSAVTTAGTAYSKKSLIITLAGSWEKFDVLGDEDGNNICHGTFQAAYDSTAALFGEIVVVNETAAL